MIEKIKKMWPDGDYMNSMWYFEKFRNRLSKKSAPKKGLFGGLFK